MDTGCFHVTCVINYASSAFQFNSPWSQILILGLQFSLICFVISCSLRRKIIYLIAWTEILSRLKSWFVPHSATPILLYVNIWQICSSNSSGHVPGDCPWLLSTSHASHPIRFWLSLYLYPKLQSFSPSPLLLPLCIQPLPLSRVTGLSPTCGQQYHFWVRERGTWTSSYNSR